MNCSKQCPLPPWARYAKLKPFEEDETDYKRVLEIFRKYNVRYFLYNGGNDSMDTVCKIGAYLKAHGYKCNVVGVPKTIDNDLALTDHCPGFGSAAKYIAASCMELSLGFERIFQRRNHRCGNHGTQRGLADCGKRNRRFQRSRPRFDLRAGNPFDISAFMDDVSAVYKPQGRLLCRRFGRHKGQGRQIYKRIRERACDGAGQLQPQTVGRRGRIFGFLRKGAHQSQGKSHRIQSLAALRKPHSQQNRR